MIVFSDTTPLSNFLQIGKLSLLEGVYGEIFIPQLV
jgi:predicted nucleic acid-binding protein